MWRWVDSGDVRGWADKGGVRGWVDRGDVRCGWIEVM